MKNIPNLIAFAVAFLLPHAAFSADVELKPLMLVTDQIIYHDEFATAQAIDKETWHVAQGTQWKAEDGVLRGRPSTSEFQASHKTHKGLEPRCSLSKCPADYVVRFSVRYVGGKPPRPLPALKNIPSIDIGHHIGRVEFGLEGTRLTADGETLQLESASAFRLESGRWYEVLVEARGDEVVVQFANGPTFHGKHPTLGGENHHLAFVGSEEGVVEIDNVTLWSVKSGTQPSWTETLVKRPAQEPKVLRKKRPGQLAKEKEAEAKTKP